MEEKNESDGWFRGHAVTPVLHKENTLSVLMGLAHNKFVLEFYLHAGAKNTTWQNLYHVYITRYLSSLIIRVFESLIRKERIWYTSYNLFGFF